MSDFRSFIARIFERVMPAAVGVLIILLIVTADDGRTVALVGGAYFVANVVLGQLITRRWTRDERADVLIGPVRGGLAAVFLPLFVGVSNPEFPGWVVALPTPSAPGRQRNPRWQLTSAIAIPKNILLKMPTAMSDR